MAKPKPFPADAIYERHALRMRHEDHALGGLGSYKSTGQSPGNPGDFSRGIGAESDAVPHGPQPGPYAGTDNLGESHSFRSSDRSHALRPREK